MKLIIQIPCLNEEETLPQTIADLPRRIPGIDQVEYLVIDDGSTDGTVEKAIELGVDHVVSLPMNRGLAKAFSVGVEACLRLGADIVVNTDADNQYCGADVATLVAPIVERRSEIVIGCRPIREIKEFSLLKKALQRLGSFVVRQLSTTEVADVTSGFRAYSRYAALRINIVSSFSYTLESIIQAGHRAIPILGVPIRVNPKTRESRLFRSMGEYILRSTYTMVKLSTQFRPLKTFGAIGGLSFVLGVSLGLRYLAHFFQGFYYGHEQSSILAAVLLLFGGFSFLVGLLADQVAANRLLVEESIALSREQLVGSDQPIPFLIYSKAR